MKNMLLIAILIFLSVVASHADEQADVKKKLVPITLDTAPLILLKADVGGDATANLILAEASFHGVVLVKSNNEAFKWYLRAAERGSAMAENSLGYLYDNGLGVARDPKLAADWYLKAAQHGYPSAWFNIANCFEYGVGVKQNYKEAVHWYVKAAQAGDVEAQMKLATLYENGAVEGSEPEDGFQWLRRAAELGNGAAIKKIANVQFVHDSTDATVMENFMDDLVSLLPSDLASILGANKKTFLEYGRLPMRYDCWLRKVPQKADFIRYCQDSASRLKNPKDAYNDSLTHLMGFSIRTIVEIALSGNRFDPSNAELQKNMMKFARNGNDQEYSVNYPGYKSQSLDSAVDRLYELRKVSTANIYPQLVVATADIWVTIWKESGREVRGIPYSFVRTALTSALMD